MGETRSPFLTISGDDVRCCSGIAAIGGYPNIYKRPSGRLLKYGVAFGNG